MKLMHLSDLHLGKRLYECSLIIDQQYILKQIITIALQNHIDGIIIAGDIYDKSIPSEEAIVLFDTFLSELVNHQIKVYLISGNHDSGKRLSYASKLMKESGVYIASEYEKEIMTVSEQDEFGTVNFYLLPFFKPAHVRNVDDIEVTTYDEAFAQALSKITINDERNVLITHQFVLGASTCDSEQISVGGSDQISASHMKAFDYVALGHLHRPQSIGDPHIRYCGTPLKYSFSEANHRKSVTIVTLKQKGTIQIETIDLTPLHDVKEIKGTYLKISNRSFYEQLQQNDYLHITLTDEEEEPNVMGKLRVLYPNLLKLDYENTRTKTTLSVEVNADLQVKSGLALFEELYVLQNNQPMNDTQKAYMKELLEKIEEQAS